MKIDISPSTDIQEIAPILRLLRDSLTHARFMQRLVQAQKNGQRYLLAKSVNATNGCLSYHITFDVFWGKTLYVDDLVVAPNLRSQGLGAKLLDAAKAEAKAQNCDHLRLCSGLTRDDAHRFYENNGVSKSSFQFAHALS